MGTSADLLVKATAADNTVRALAAVTTGLVNEARQRHRTAPTASAALGRTLTAAALLGAQLKDDETLSIQFLGSGPLRGILVDANARGEVRGFVYEPRAHVPVRNGKLNVGGIVGQGDMAVIRSRAWGKTPYRSIVPIVSGEIGQDIAHYLRTSEQIPSAVSLGVFVLPDERVEAAGGFLIQVMPGAGPATIGAIEACVAAAPPVSPLVRQGASSQELLATVLAELDPTPVEACSIRFQCRCTRDRVLGALVALGAAELGDLLEKEGKAEVTCEFCNQRYSLDGEDLQGLLASLAD